MSATANIRINAHAPVYRFIREIDIDGITESLDEVQVIGDVIARLTERRNAILHDRENLAGASTGEGCLRLAQALDCPLVTIPAARITIGPGFTHWYTTLELLSQSSREAVYDALVEEEQRRSDAAERERIAAEAEQATAEPGEFVPVSS